MEKYKTYHDIPDSEIPIEDFELDFRQTIRDAKKKDAKENKHVVGVTFWPQRGKHDRFIRVMEAMNKKSKLKNALWAIPVTITERIYLDMHYNHNILKAKDELITCIKYDLWKWEYNKGKDIKIK